MELCGLSFMSFYGTYICMSRGRHPNNLGLHILHSASPLGLVIFWCHHNSHNSIEEPSTADGKKKWKPASSTHASHLEHKSLYQPPFTRNSTREANKVYSAAYPLISLFACWIVATAMAGK